SSDRDVPDRADGQVHLERLPMVAIVEGDVDALLRPGVEKPPALRIFADDVDVAADGNSLSDRRPRLSAVPRAVDVRADVVQAIAVHGGIDRGRVDARRLGNR